MRSSGSSLPILQDWGNPGPHHRLPPIEWKENRQKKIKDHTYNYVFNKVKSFLILYGTSYFVRGFMLFLNQERDEIYCKYLQKFE